MNASEACQLIEAAIPEKIKANWADLGCGGGTFTEAIADLLGEGSKIWAVDKLNQHVASRKGNVQIEFVQADIERQQLELKDLDGIIIANTLHYIKDQSGFLKGLRSYLKDGGKLVLVEYNTERSNQWVPFPVTYEKAASLLTQTGFKNISMIGEHPSSFRGEMIFACVAYFLI